MCSVALSSANFSFAAAGGTGTINVTAANGCSWQVQSTVPWIVITSGTQGSGNGAVVFTVLGNSDIASRTASITVGGQNVTIVQQGVSAQIKVLPQLAFGSDPVLGRWSTSIYLHNTTSSVAQVLINFYGVDGSPLVVPGVGAASKMLSLSPRASVVLDIPATGSLTQGWVQLRITEGIVGYGIFRQSAEGVNPQEGTVPLSGSTSQQAILVFDETEFVTALAVLNPTESAVSVTMTARDETGTILSSSTFRLGPRERQAFTLRDKAGMSAVLGKRGSLDVAVNSGAISVLGLRFNRLAFTSVLPMER
jgi:hypothetical protein